MTCHTNLLQPSDIQYCIYSIQQHISGQYLAPTYVIAHTKYFRNYIRTQLITNIRISNTPLGLSQYHACSHNIRSIYTHPVNPSLSVLNCAPCSGLVSMLANILFVLKCRMTASPASTRSLSQKNRMSMCLLLSDVDLPFSINAIVLRLSWYITSGPTSCPCSLMKFLT